MATVRVNPKYYEGGDYVLAEIYIYDALSVSDVSLVDSMDVTLLVKGTTVLDIASVYSVKSSDTERYNIFFVHPLDITELTVKAVATLTDSSVVSGTASVITVPEVYGSMFPLNTNLTPQGERIEENAYRAKRVDLVEPSYDKVILDEQTVLVLCDVDFADGLEYFKLGNTPIDYRGGGNRLLDSLSGDLSTISQGVQVYPSDVGGTWLSEISATNLLLNSTFLTASGLTFSQTKPSLMVDVSYTEYVTSAVNYLNVRGRSLEAYSPTATTWSITSSNYSISGNSTAVFSTWGYGSKGTTDTIVNDLTMYLNYYGPSGYISTVSGLFSTSSILSAWSLLTLRDTTPATATSFTAGFKVGTFEGPDDFSLKLLLPQVEYGTDPTSRIPTNAITKTRLRDIITLPTDYNFEQTKGSFIIKFVPHYFSMWGDRYFFDTTDPTSQYGYSAYHRASDSAIVFKVVDGVDIITLASPPEVLNPYQEYVLKFSWSDEGLSIELDDTYIGALTSTVPTLATISDSVFVGEDYQGVKQLFGEIISFEIWRDTSD